MAVDPNWLQQVRENNRKQFGMAGLGQTEDIASTLQRVRAARTARGMQDKERTAALRAQEVLAQDPDTAALLTLPEVSIPAAQPLPRELLIAAGVVAAGLFGLILIQTLRGGK